MKTWLFLSIKKIPKLKKIKKSIFGRGNTKTFNVISPDMKSNGTFIAYNDKFLYFRVFNLYFMFGFRKRIF